MARSPITMTDAAVERVQHLLASRGKESMGIRIGVKKGGCSGLSYIIEYADDIKPFEEVVKYADTNQDELFTLIIDPKAIIYLIGSEMDFVDEKLKSGFIFQNPNSKGECGCGESFNV